MCCPLSLVVTNFFMESFETEMLNTTPLKPALYWHFVEDTLLICPHSQEALIEFVGVLYSHYDQIRFINEIEQARKLPFLDMVLIKQQDRSLGRMVYRKPTYTNWYKNSHSHYHPAQKFSFISKLLHRAKGIADSDHLPEELATLRGLLM